MTHFCSFLYIIFFWTLQIPFVIHNTTHGSNIKVTILICGWCQAICSKLKCHMREFPMCFPNIPNFWPVVYICMFMIPRWTSRNIHIDLQSFDAKICSCWTVKAYTDDIQWWWNKTCKLIINILRDGCFISDLLYLMPVSLEAARCYVIMIVSLWLHSCRSAWQISERLEESEPESRSFETSRDIVASRPSA